MNLVKAFLSSSAALALCAWDTPVLVAATDEPRRNTKDLVTTTATVDPTKAKVLVVTDEPTCWECGIIASNVDLYLAIDPNNSGSLTVSDVTNFIAFWFTLGSPPSVCKSVLYGLYENGDGANDPTILAMMDYINLAGDDCNGCVVFEDMISCLQKVIVGLCPIPTTSICQDCGITDDNVSLWKAIDPTLDFALDIFDLVAFGKLRLSMGSPEIVCRDDLNAIYLAGNGGFDPTIAAFTDYIIAFVDGDCVAYDFMIQCLTQVILGNCPQ